MTTVESLARPASGAGGEAAMTGAVAMARQLKAYGVEYVFGTCGHTNIALLVALEQVGIDFVIARHEQAAAHAADGYARVSGKPGVLLVHVGPGMMNAVTGVATAALDSVPLVAIAGDVPSYMYGRHPHQEVNLHSDADQTAIFQPFVKRAWHAHRVEDLPRFLERAFWTATSGRPGAVLLNVPWTCSPGRCPVMAPRPIQCRRATRPDLPPTTQPGSREALLGARAAIDLRGRWPSRRRRTSRDRRAGRAPRRTHRPLAHGERDGAGRPSASARHAGILGHRDHELVHAERGRRAGDRHAVRGDRREFLGSGLHVAIPAVAPDPDRHRPC